MYLWAINWQSPEWWPKCGCISWYTVYHTTWNANTGIWVFRRVGGKGTVGRGRYIVLMNVERSWHMSWYIQINDCCLGITICQCHRPGFLRWMVTLRDHWIIWRMFLVIHGIVKPWWPVPKRTRHPGCGFLWLNLSHWWLYHHSWSKANKTSPLVMLHVTHANSTTTCCLCSTISFTQSVKILKTYRIIQRHTSYHIDDRCGKSMKSTICRLFSLKTMYFFPHWCHFGVMFSPHAAPRSAGANFLLAAWCGVQELRKKRRKKRHLLALLTCFSVLALLLRHDIDIMGLGQNIAGVGKCPFWGILNITFKYLFEIISPIVGWC